MKYMLTITSDRLRPVAAAPGRADWTSIRLALQVAAGAAACLLWVFAPTDAGSPQNILGASPVAWVVGVVGGAFGLALIALTYNEAAGLANAERIALDQARELARVEIRERESKLPAPLLPRVWLKVPTGAVEVREGGEDVEGQGDKYEDGEDA